MKKNKNILFGVIFALLLVVGFGTGKALFTDRAVSEKETIVMVNGTDTRIGVTTKDGNLRIPEGTKTENLHVIVYNNSVGKIYVDYNIEGVEKKNIEISPNQKFEEDITVDNIEGDIDIKFDTKTSEDGDVMETDTATIHANL